MPILFAQVGKGAMFALGGVGSRGERNCRIEDFGKEIVEQLHILVAIICDVSNRLLVDLQNWVVIVGRHFLDIQQCRAHLLVLYLVLNDGRIEHRLDVVVSRNILVFGRVEDVVYRCWPVSRITTRFVVYDANGV